MKENDAVFFQVMEKIHRKDAWNWRPAHLALTNYYDAESPAVRALSFVKEVFDGVLDGLPKSYSSNLYKD